MDRELSYRLARKYRDATVKEVDALKELVRRLSPNPLIVNIGAGNRAISTLAILEERPDAVIFSIDTHVKENEKHYLIEAELDWRRVIRLLGRSQDIGRFFPGELDMVYVDGAHRYVEVIEDIEVWLPRIRPKGIMAFHDNVDLNGKPTQAGRAIAEKMVWQTKILEVDRIVAFQKMRKG